MNDDGWSADDLFRVADVPVVAAFAQGHDVGGGERLAYRVGPVTISGAAVRQFDGPAPSDAA